MLVMILRTYSNSSISLHEIFVNRCLSFVEYMMISLPVCTKLRERLVLVTVISIFSKELCCSDHRLFLQLNVRNGTLPGMVRGTLRC